MDKWDETDKISKISRKVSHSTSDRNSLLSSKTSPLLLKKKFTHLYPQLHKKKIKETKINYPIILPFMSFFFATIHFFLFSFSALFSLAFFLEFVSFLTPMFFSYFFLMGFIRFFSKINVPLQSYSKYQQK